MSLRCNPVDRCRCGNRADEDWTTVFAKVVVHLRSRIAGAAKGEVV